MLSNVLIIDDVIDETNNIRKAFLEKGYAPLVVQPEEINTDFSYIPDIICCDINLSGTNKEQNFKTIYGLLNRIIKQEKLYLFIAWTNNKELFKELKDFLSSKKDLKKPLKYKCFPKEDFNIDTFNKMVKQIYTQNRGLISLYDWNDIIISSINKQLYFIKEISKNNKCSIEDILCSLGEKTAGEENFFKNKRNKILSTCTFLHLLLEDSIDSTIMSKLNSLNLFKDIVHLSPESNIPEEELNSFLVISENTSSTILNVGDFISIDKNLFINGKKRKKIQDNFRKNIAGIDLLKKCTWGIINITADCDSSNNKQGIDKFVLASLIGYSKMNKKPRVNSPSLITYLVKQGNKKKLLIIYAKYIFGIDSKDIKRCKKLFKIRKQCVDSIRQQVYSYNSRIGTISF